MTTLPDWFVKAIAAAPDDDAPRLAAADWWQEHGEGERAEFVRVQIGIERFPNPTFDDRRALEQKLLQSHDYWDCLPFPTYAAHYQWAGTDRNTRVFRRGFIESIICPAADCLAHLDAIRAQHPVRRVRLTTWPGEWATPHTCTIRHRGVAVRAVHMEPGIAAQNCLRGFWPDIRFGLPEPDYEQLARQDQRRILEGAMRRAFARP
jgi:uncharacterized protein (TIGR02996 family)